MGAKQPESLVYLNKENLKKIPEEKAASASACFPVHCKATPSL